MIGCRPQSILGEARLRLNRFQRGLPSTRPTLIRCIRWIDIQLTQFNWLTCHKWFDWLIGFKWFKKCLKKSNYDPNVYKLMTWQTVFAKMTREFLTVIEQTRRLVNQQAKVLSDSYMTKNPKHQKAYNQPWSYLFFPEILIGPTEK